MTPAEGAANVGRLVQSMRVFVRDGVSEATVHLRPEHLGEVSIALRVDGRSVSAVVRADAPGVREWMNSQSDALRQGLAQQGLSLDRLVVEPDDRRGRRDGPEGEPRRPRHRPAEPHEQFVVTV